MGILDKLKEFFLGLRKEKPKRLMPADNEKIKSKNEISKYVLRTVKEPSLEECIEEFINQYSTQQEIYGQDRTDKVYKAFITMFCNNKEEEGNNFENQKDLKKDVRKAGYYISNQISNDIMVFMHITVENSIDKYKNNGIEKLYINCARKDIASLTDAIFHQIHPDLKDKLQMKCISEQFLKEGIESEQNRQFKNYQRNDKIVIYSENHAMTEFIAKKINELRVEKPELFSTVRTMPLLPKMCGFIGVGKEELHQHAKTPIGYAAGSTYNDYLSDILFQSIVAGFDKKLSRTSSGHELSPEERMSEYISIYHEMIPEQKKEIINKSKEIFLQICRDNNVNTIYTPTSTRENQSAKVEEQFVH